MIEDPFKGSNEKMLQWIGLTDWEYRLYFKISKNLKHRDTIYICFDKMIIPMLSSFNDKKSKNTSNLDNQNIVEQLNSLNNLYKSGVLTKEEFEKAKKRILN